MIRVMLGKNPDMFVSFMTENPLLTFVIAVVGIMVAGCKMEKELGNLQKNGFALAGFSGPLSRLPKACEGCKLD